jgi:hypothetical protein
VSISELKTFYAGKLIMRSSVTVCLAAREVHELAVIGIVYVDPHRFMLQPVEQALVTCQCALVVDLVKVKVRGRLYLMLMHHHIEIGRDAGAWV